MSKHSSNQRTVVLLVAIILSVTMVVPDFFALTFDQNTNSSTTMTEQETTTTTTMRSTRRRRRNRRMRRRAMRRRARAMGADMSGANMATDANMAANTSVGVASAENTSGGMTDDLSGTYTGTLSMPEHNMRGPATLTVTGTTYTLDAGSMQHSGRFVANTTRGYTAVTAELGPTDAGQTPKFVSLRARRLGSGGLSLMSVPGEATRFSFTTAGGARRRRGSHGSMTAEPPDATMTTTDSTNTSTDAQPPASDTDADAAASGAMTTGTNSRRRRRGRRSMRRRARPAVNMSENMNMNMNNNMTP